MPLQVRSYAKINWMLEVLDRRPDGYHELRTVFQTIALHDRLTITARPDNQIELICNDPAVPCDQTNLVHRAVRLVQARTGIERGVRLELDKRIPVAAGLGGGSSNAAATILALQELWQVKLAPLDLFEIGTALGADVPFFFFGGTAVGIGRGNEVYPVDDVAEPHLLLVNPRVAVPTASAYAGLSSALTRNRSVAIMSFALLTPYAAYRLPTVTRNDLEQSVLPRWPQIAEVKQRLAATAARTVLMSGSGATVFAVYPSEAAQQAAAADLAATDWLVIPSRTVGREEYQRSLIGTS